MSTSIDQYLESLARRALLATQLPASGEDVHCCQGGEPLGLPGESWPEFEGERMFPVLTISTGELPFVPSFLRGADSWTFFIQPGAWEHATSDGSLVVRRYSSPPRVEGRRHAASPPRLGLEFHEVLDYPSEEAIFEALADSPVALQEFEQDCERLVESFPCHSGIKLGGYPYLIQPGGFLASLASGFEIQIDVTDLYMYADSGVGYIYDGLSKATWSTM